jgi:hypothetical protein
MLNFFWTFIAFVACGSLPVQAGTQSPITVGPGPEIGRTAGQVFFEEFQDWDRNDCLAIDPALDGAEFDKDDRVRDLLAFYARDEVSTDSYFFRADFLDLLYGAEKDQLDLVVLLDFGSPGQGQKMWPGTEVEAANGWELAIIVGNSETWQVYNENHQTVTSNETNPGLWRGAYFNSDLDAVEFGMVRSVLLEHGWDGRSPFNIQVGTRRNSDDPHLADILPDHAPDGSPMSISTCSVCPTAKFAFVIHGNQTMHNAEYIQDLIYNTSITTPAGNPTGYFRVLETARIFEVPVNIHVSATLLSSALWADSSQQKNDGPGFVRELKSFFDGDFLTGNGSLIWGVYSEHIMPFFEGEVNQSSVRLNEQYLQTTLGVPPPSKHSVFWIPERVARGSTLLDLAEAGYNYTILDQINHLKNWFGDKAAEHDGYKINRINGINVFMINDEPDRFKFANTDGGLRLSMRVALSELANSADQEQLMLVFDDWEAYAGRSFLSFDKGTDNPDNFNANIRWLANRPWIEVVSLEEVAARGWAPVDRGFKAELPFESYDFLEFATAGNYQNWYHGSDKEEDFDDFHPWIREDLGIRGNKKFGALQSYVDSTSGASGGPGSIVHDVWQDIRSSPRNNLRELAEIAFSVSMFETAWHDEYDAIRGKDGTFDGEDKEFDSIAGFAKEMNFLHGRRAGIFALGARWADDVEQGKQKGTTVEEVDVDHDGELEYVLKNELVWSVFENDGGRLIKVFGFDASGNPVALMGNLLGAPEGDDERETTEDGGARHTSGLADRWAEGLSTAKYVNDLFKVEKTFQGLSFTSSDGAITKQVTLLPGAARLQVTYELAPEVGRLFVRNGLSPDLANLLETGQSVLRWADDGHRLCLWNAATGAAVGVNYACENVKYNAHGGDDTRNSPRNQILNHIIELELTGPRAQFDIILEASSL